MWERAERREPRGKERVEGLASRIVKEDGHRCGWVARSGLGKRLKDTRSWLEVQKPCVGRLVGRRGRSVVFTLVV